MKRRWLAFLAALCMVLQFTVVPADVRAQGAVDTDTYFKEQLSGTQALFYSAMQTMYDNGSLKTGKGSVELTGELSQAQLKAYSEGDPSLAKDFQCARDAFSQDQCDVFYVDFSKLTFRMGMKDGQYVAYLNNGTNEHFYCSTFQSEGEVNQALSQAQEAKQAIIGEVRDTLNLPDSVTGREAEVVTAVHDALVGAVSYSYPSDSEQDVHGVYGALVGGLGNCAGYARSLKWILDEFGIPCVLVSGIGENSRKINEEHMWNYVEIGGYWYAVDATWDDPIGADTVRDDYLLRGSDRMLANHYPLGELSPAGKTFEYPALSDLDYTTRRDSEEGIVVSDSVNGLVVDSKPGIDAVGDAFTEFSISYNGMDIQQAYEAGYYIAARFIILADDEPTLGDSEQTIGQSVAASRKTLGYSAGDKPNAQVGPWTGLYAFAINNYDGAGHMQIFRKYQVQFCVTRMAPTGSLSEYLEDLSLPKYSLAVTKKLSVLSYSDYVSPPFIVSCDPVLTKVLMPHKQHFTVEFDERFVVQDEALPISITVSSTQPHIKTEVQNLTYRDSTYEVRGVTYPSTIVEFDFTPDSSFQAYINLYSLQLENLIGVDSRKKPNPLPIRTTYKMTLPCPSYVAEGAIPDAFVVALPTLVVNEAMDIFEYTEDPSTSPRALDIRLVATIPGENTENALLGSLEDSALNPGPVKASATYDLYLSCSGAAARLKSSTSYNVTIGLPYPVGFNYNDNKDIVFKAYHFKKVGESYVPEELVCQITPQGLVVIADSFSPFTVVAVEKTGDSGSAHKLINVAGKTAGGVITTTINGDQVGASGLYVADRDEATTFRVQADTGYVIDKLLVNGKAADLPENATQATQSFSYTDMPGESSLQAYFIAQSVKAEEKKEGFSAIQPVLVPSGVTPPSPDSSSSSSDSSSSSSSSDSASSGSSSDSSSSGSSSNSSSSGSSSDSASSGSSSDSASSGTSSGSSSGTSDSGGGRYDSDSDDDDAPSKSAARPRTKNAKKSSASSASASSLPATAASSAPAAPAPLKANSSAPVSSASSSASSASSSEPEASSGSSASSESGESQSSSAPSASGESSSAAMAGASAKSGSSTGILVAAFVVVAFACAGIAFIAVKRMKK